MLVTDLPGLAIRPRRPRAELGPGRASEGLLLIGHGSHCHVSHDEMSTIARLVSGARPDLAVEVGYLEMSDPPAGVALDRLVARGARRVTMLPLMLFAAGHAKSDVPAVVVEGRRRHPGVELRYGRPLGVDHGLCAMAHDNIAAVGGTGLPLLVIARGTSDPDANAEAHRAARLLAEFEGAPFVVTGFSGVTWPRVPEALDMCARLGATRVVVFSWFLCHGKLVQRILGDEAAFAAASGGSVEVVDAGYFGPDPRLVPLILDRLGEAARGAVVMSCDTCAYRRPFPALEERVGQPIGVGHSHLAAEHRAHSHDAHHPGHAHSGSDPPVDHPGRDQGQTHPAHGRQPGPALRTAPAEAADAPPNAG